LNPQGEPLGRIAMATPTEKFRDIVGRLKRTINYIAASPPVPAMEKIIADRAFPA
jgi:hypothetical protein